MPDLRVPDTGGLDWRGFTLTAVGIAALVVGMERSVVGIGEPEWAVVAVGFGGATVTLGAAVYDLLHARRPLLDLRILRLATYRVTALGGSVFRAVISAIPFLLPLFFQLGFGWTAAQECPRFRRVRRFYLCQGGFGAFPE